MKIIWNVAVFLVITLASMDVIATDAPVIKITRLTEKLHMLTTDQGAYTTNSLAFVGDDGILLVDTQSATEAADLKRVIDSFGKGSPKYIINTHRHVEHIGGNAIFGDTPIIIAHDLLPLKLKSGGYIFDEVPETAYPDITLRDSISLYFNGERIDIRELAGSHDDNEIIVHFTDSKFVHLSSVVNGFNFPSVDDDGSPLKFAELVQRAMKMLPEDVSIISGHNDIGDCTELRPYLDMLVETERAVREGVAAGKDLETMQSEKIFEKWEKYAGSYVSSSEWMEYLFEAITVGKDPRKKVFIPVYHTWKQEGANKALEHYHELVKHHSGEYRTDELTLLIIGDKLLANGHPEDAAVFLKASLQEHPESKYAYYAAYRLANLYDDKAETERAIDYCKMALALNPDMKAAAILLDKLERR